MHSPEDISDEHTGWKGYYIGTPQQPDLGSTGLVAGQKAPVVIAATRRRATRMFLIGIAKAGRECKSIRPQKLGSVNKENIEKFSRHGG